MRWGVLPWCRVMDPIIIRASDVVIRLVPGNLKEASYALRAGHVRTVWHVVLPTARSGLMTAVILGTTAARAWGPLVIVAVGSAYLTRLALSAYVDNRIGAGASTTAEPSAGAP